MVKRGVARDSSFESKDMIMAKTIPFFLMIFLFSGFAAALAKDNQPGRVEVTFDYNRAERDYANNQFAVWVEEQDGTFVRTLFVTEFTATKGWKIRKEALPTWKKKANLSLLAKEGVDAISGATPKAGRLAFSWDGKRADGSFVPPGDYTYFVECNYYWQDTVLYKGTIRVGTQKDTSKAEARFSTESAKNYTIIENVAAEFTPLR